MHNRIKIFKIKSNRKLCESLQYYLQLYICQQKGFSVVWSPHFNLALYFAVNDKILAVRNTIPSTHPSLNVLSPCMGEVQCKEGPLYFFSWNVIRPLFLVKHDLGFFRDLWLPIFDFCVNVNEFWELSVTREQSQYFYVNAFCKVV